MGTRRAVVIVLPLVLAVTTMIGIVHWASLPQPVPTRPAAPEPVALTLQDSQAELTIGVILSLTSPTGEATDWRYAAEGARVASERLAMGGDGPTLIGVDDGGTEEGAAAAVDELVDQGADAIVLGSSGSHIQGAVEAAQPTGIALLIPYADEVAASETGQPVWQTGPTADQVDAALDWSLSTAEVQNPVLIEAGGRIPDELEPSATFEFSPGDQTDALIEEIESERENEAFAMDAIVIAGDAETQARIVRALQGTTVNVPIYLTPQATSPAFAAALAEVGGSLAAGFTSVGVETGDSAALRSSEQGRAMSSYLSALRMVARDSAVLSVMGDQPFAEVAYAADARSHDAVVAIATAAAVADSTDPAALAAALGTLQLGSTDGLAGVPLDFTADEVVAVRDIGPLAASGDDLGLRSAGSQRPRLNWFAAPGA